MSSELQKHEADTRQFAQVRLLLVAERFPGRFYLFQERSFPEVFVEYLQLRLSVYLGILVLFQIIVVVDGVWLPTFHLGRDLCIFCSVADTANLTRLALVHYGIMWRTPFLSESAFDFRVTEDLHDFFPTSVSNHF